MVLGLLLSRCPNVPVIQDLARQYGVDRAALRGGGSQRKVHPLRAVRAGLQRHGQAHTCSTFPTAASIAWWARRSWRRRRDCIGCGACTIVCPTGAIEIVLEKEALYQEKPLGPTSAIYVPSLQAVPRVPVIDTDSCIRFRQQARGGAEDACGVCQTLCEARAIDFTQKDEIDRSERGRDHRRHRFRRFRPCADAAVLLWQVAQHHHRHGVRAAVQRQRADRRPDPHRRRCRRPRAWPSCTASAAATSTPTSTAHASAACTR